MRINRNHLSELGPQVRLDTAGSCGSFLYILMKKIIVTVQHPHMAGALRLQSVGIPERGTVTG